MKFRIDHSPVSINQLYFQPKGSRSKVLTPLGREFKAKVVNDITLQLKSVTNLAYFCDKTLKLELYYGSNWYNKDGTIKKKDISNYEKAVVDSLFDCLPQLDDSQIFRNCLNKVQSKTEFVVIVISVTVDNLVDIDEILLR